jgi:WD40 repeat protein
VAFSPDGNKGASVERGGSCLVWDAKGEAAPRKLEIRAGVTALSPDGKLLCFSDGNDTVLFELASGRKLSTLGRFCEDVAFSPDGKKIAKGDDSFPKTVQLWDTKTGKQLWASKGHNNRITRLRFTPDGKRILSMDGVRLHVWDTENGDEIGRFRIGRKTVASWIACAPDGRIILVGDREGGLTLHKFPK